MNRWGELIPHDGPEPDTSVRRYRSPLGEVEAIHWTGPETSAKVFDFMGLRHPGDLGWGRFCAVERSTYRGAATYGWGEWIVKDASGEFHPVNSETFAAEYEALPGERSEP